MGTKIERENMKKKVLLGMSGGVDSSVSAIILQEQGYEVIGVTLNLFSCASCCSYIDVKSVCNTLGIPHFIIEGKDVFQKYVINDFINCYKKCTTPNPCIECNKYMKFGLMYEKAKELGCDYIATGHYAKTEYCEKYNQYVLKKSNAGKKDQSYVLYNLPQDMIDKVLFPLANFESKDEIRKIAKEHNLIVANKPDSEDICFIPDGNYKKFLEQNSDLKAKEGNIVTRQGKVIGKHTGLYKYTIGQRKGLGLSLGYPAFVLEIRPETNEVVIGTNEDSMTTTLKANRVNFMSVEDLPEPKRVFAKIRYNHKGAWCTVEKTGEDEITCTFEEPQRAVTPGQAVVLYDGEYVLGGGTII